MKYTCIILILLITNAASAQFLFGTSEHDGLFKNDRSWMGNLGYTYQNEHLLEFGVKRTSIDASKGKGDGQYGMIFLDYSYWIFGGELLLKEHVQVAPKVGVGYNLLFANANLNFILYNNDFKTFSPSITPEIGLSFSGFFQINYGYNFYLANADKLMNTRHRISFRINLLIPKRKS